MLKCKSQLPKVLFKINGIKYGKSLKLIGWPFIYRFSKSDIIIGNQCTINSSFFSNLIGLYQRTIIIARGGKIKIGDNVGISGSTIYSRKEIVIEDNSIIGANCKIIDNDFHGILSDERNKQECIKDARIFIGKNSFIGCNCIILKGTTLGKNCIVGAGSVVNGKFKDNCIIVGNPARVIKYIDDYRSS